LFYYALNNDYAYFLIIGEKEMSESISLDVTGMKCGGCESNVKDKLNAMDGIVSVEASSKENKVDVEFDSGATNVEAISKVITDAGFVVN
jgi:copper chaperone